MKKTILAALLLCALLLTGCGDNGGDSATEPEDNGTVISSGDYFKVIEQTKDGVTRYSYSVTDKNGETLESALCAEQPKVAAINPDLIGVRFTDGEHMFCRYYDLKNGMVSESYFNAFWDDGTLVAYNDYENGHKMVVRSIFDYGSYYHETEVDCPAWKLTVVSCEQNEDTGELTVGYVYGEQNESTGTVKLPTRLPAEGNSR